MENQDIQQLDQLERPDGAYDENQIQVLEGLEAVRKRPGMYIGSTDERGLHHLVYEIVDNAVDEALAGFCNEIIITLHKDGSCSVQDNGRGFPVGIHPKIGRPAVEVCLTILHAGGKFGGGGYKVSGGLHGVGASVVNALSKHMQVNVYQDGKIYQQEYARGKVLYDLKVIGETERTGTTIRFWPDVKAEDDPDGIFETGDFQYDVLKTRFREMAFLNRGIRIVFRDERPEEPKENVFHYEGGISEFVKFINKNKEVLFAEPIYISGLVGTTSVEVAMQYNDTYSENIFAFVNNIHTPDGGTHLAGFNMALTRVINDYGRKHNILKANDTNLSGEDTREGLAAIVSVKLEDPQFESQTKSKLGNSEVRTIVNSLVGKQLADYLEENPQVAKLILDRCLAASRAREAARKARDPPQDGAGEREPAGQAGGLLRARPGQVRNLPRRGRFRRRQRQDGARPPLPGDSAAARQDSERREDAAGSRARQRRNQGDDYGVRLRRGRRVRHHEAALRPHRLHDGRRRGRQPHPHPDADVLLPLHAPADRAGARLRRSAAALQGDLPEDGALLLFRRGA